MKIQVAFEGWSSVAFDSSILSVRKCKKTEVFLDKDLAAQKAGLTKESYLTW